MQGVLPSAVVPLRGGTQEKHDPDKPRKRMMMHALPIRFKGMVLMPWDQSRIVTANMSMFLSRDWWLFCF